MNPLLPTHIVIDNLQQSGPWYYQLIPGIIPAFIGLLSVIAYFIKKHYDSKESKKQVKFTLFHNQRLAAITDFIKAYTPLETFFWQIPYRDVAKGNLKPKDIDAIYLPLYNVFLASFYALHLVLTDNELENFNDIHKEINLASSELSELYFTDVTDKQELLRATNAYVKEFSQLRVNNASRLKKIGNEFRYSYQ